MRRWPSILAFALIFLTAGPASAADPAAQSAEPSPQFTEVYELGRQLYKRGDYVGAIDALTKAIQLQPDLLKGYLGRGYCHLAGKRYDEALADFEKAHSLGERTPRLFGMRGYCHLGLGDYRRGRKYLRKAIRLNPGDVGQEYRPSNKKKLSPEAIAHGERQVRQMLEDRPAMKQGVQEGDALWRWTVRKFAGEDLDDTIDWDSTVPIGSDANHTIPTDSQRGQIRVAPRYRKGPKQGELRSCDELWAEAVFELHNIVGAEDFQRLKDKAARGELQKKEFVLGMFEIEYRALQRTRAFYVKVYLRLAEKNGTATLPAGWHAHVWETAEQYLDRCTDRSKYPWVPYGRWFDWYAAYRFWEQGAYAECRWLMESVAERQLDPQRKAESLQWIGRCCDEQGDHSAAEKAYTEAIRLAPGDAHGYTGRARARANLGRFDEALADTDAALRIDPKDTYAMSLKTWVLSVQLRLRTNGQNGRTPIEQMDRGMLFDALERRQKMHRQMRGRQRDQPAPAAAARTNPRQGLVVVSNQRFQLQREIRSVSGGDNRRAEPPHTSALRSHHPPLATG